MWRELSGLRRRVEEQEAQIDRQEAIITACTQQQRTSTPPRPGSRDSAHEQQLRIAEVRWMRGKVEQREGGQGGGGGPKTKGRSHSVMRCDAVV